MRKLVLVLATMVLVAACNNNDTTSAPSGGGGGGGSSNLVSSASSPADGNATMTDAGTITVNSGGSGFDELDLSQTVGGVGHEVVVTWDTNTHVLNGVQHVWGSGTTTSGFTQCAPGAACDAAKVAIDFAGQKVTFTGLVVNDAFGGSATSTLTGTLAW